MRLGFLRSRMARRSLATAFGLALAGLLFALAASSRVASSASGRCTADVAEVPAAPVALVLGCTAKLADGRDNLYFTRRIDAAAELFHAGKVGALIVSGDNSRSDYDEPTAMKDALVARGVPAGRVWCDFAGFRTLDSVVRAREVFGQRRLIVVSQRFHAERAIYLARARGIDAHGFEARAVGGVAGVRARARELAARALAVADVALGAEPKFLGPSIEITAHAPLPAQR